MADEGASRQVVAYEIESRRRRQLATLGMLLALVLLAGQAVTAWLQYNQARRDQEQGRDAACHVLEHRITSRESFRAIILTLKSIALAAASDPDESRFRRKAQAIEVPAATEPGVVTDYELECEDRLSEFNGSLRSLDLAADLEPEPTPSPTALPGLGLFTFLQNNGDNGDNGTERSQESAPEPRSSPTPSPSPTRSPEPEPTCIVVQAANRTIRLCFDAEMP